MLAGTVPARGPGLLLTITDPDGRITADVLLDALEELRAAGAEAVQLEGPVDLSVDGAEASVGDSVRVVASTALVDGGDGGVVVDGRALCPPYRFVVVGDPATLASALAHPRRGRRQRRAARWARARRAARRGRGGRLADAGGASLRSPGPAGRGLTGRTARSAAVCREKAGPVAEDLKYTAEHEWITVVGSGEDAVLRIGITAYAQEALGDIVFVTLPAVGTEVTAGQALGEVETTKSVSDVYAPVAGTVTARNEQLDGAPELVNSDPYGEGWMFEIRPADGVEAAFSADGLLDAEAYTALTGGS